MHHKKSGHTVQVSMLVPLQTTATHAFRNAKDIRNQKMMHFAQTKELGKQMSCVRQWKSWLIYILVAALVVPLVVWTALAMAGTIWIDNDKLKAFNTQIVAGSTATGATGASGQRTVRLQDMPAYVTEALLAIEDHRYRMHLGVDPIAIVRSVWVNVAKQKKAQGGSTVTMQLARNLFLSHDKTYSRKIKEIAIAAHLELKYSKQDILEMYMNKVYFGQGQYGIENAARTYFGKTTRKHGDVPTINVAEAAMLVGLLKAPERINPVKNMELAVKRQRVVLKRMKDLGWLSEAESQLALAAKLDKAI
ncbi:transglycosylase domain-containing protein [Paenibacillus sp. 481]|uniref:transglycosylase domain-containing protein n=1 Tax=Paenibacillus sp. 481 TaxID=2835869 RepID=UPI001E2998C4|nr:transglycosylase domain-containing protein [Paenibacillus sp. 481]UHA74729.1 transglycosylase domain-containing protein [Paenibacillus sp. 481]